MPYYHNKITTKYFIVRVVHLQRSAKLSAMGCTSVLLIASYFVSGRKCAAITINHFIVRVAEIQRSSHFEAMGCTERTTH